MFWDLFPHLSTHPALISSEEPVRVELSLRVAESLVRKNVFATKEVRLHHQNKNNTKRNSDLKLLLIFICYSVSDQCQDD